MLQEVQASSLGGKHPVSALIELCTAHKISAPDFVELPAFGPDHKKTFLYKLVFVLIDGHTTAYSSHHLRNKLIQNLLELILYTLPYAT